ncbi:PcfJ domain-containing protein [Flavobacterium litorale]|uniref:PcfJ domain-containing protein n=1 Tax=Flavobacterium litorale TaxID=2856519 RepID=A0ABX8VD55_9FLAO|nr:PcfJ domain-containing protein [Flavobacterium litorale]QYJ68976.1 PcfJ domain-containing protein [Flavobacterium litorale]
MEKQITVMSKTAFAKMVERAYTTPPLLQGNKGTLASVITSHFAQMSLQNNVWKRDTFRALLLQLHAEGCFTLLKNPGFIAVLANISAFGNKTVRDIQGWKKETAVPEAQLASLIRYSFAKYPVPEFLEHVFNTDKKVHMYWYIQLGRGDSVLALSGFPVSYTSSMAHWFRLTPPTYTVPQAIRRAQALGYGATTERAEVIAWSVLANGFENEVFWAKVVQFVAKVKEEVSLDKLQVVLEHLEALRVQQPDINMKGRTWDALLRQAEMWKAEMVKRNDAAGYMQWKPAEITDFYKAEGNVVYRTVQLTSSEALYEEGYEMNHCIAEFTDDCALGEAAIFSLRAYNSNATDTDFRRILTIEVCLKTNDILEAKGKYNEMPTQEEDKLVKEWAAKEKLTFSCEYYDGFYEPPTEEVREEQYTVTINGWCIALGAIIVLLIRGCVA